MTKNIRFTECLKRQKSWYKKLQPVKSVAINGVIIFNSKGFNHLKYDGSGHRRSIKEYHYKLLLLPFVIPVIEKAKVIHDYKNKKYSKKLGKYFEIWELKEDIFLPEISNINTYTISVILRRIGNGKIHFYSVWGKIKKPS